MNRESPKTYIQQMEYRVKELKNFGKHVNILEIHFKLLPPIGLKLIKIV